MLEELDNGFVSISFELEKHGYAFKDAIIMLKEDYAKLTDSELESIKQDRFDKWYALVNQPEQVME